MDLGGARITGLHRDTILRVLLLAGQRCEALMGRLVVDVPVKDVQLDEAWVSATVRKEQAARCRPDALIGDAYCFVAIERHTKLVLNFALGRRNQATADAFIEGLRGATASRRFQVTTDGFQPYISAIDSTLSDRVDYAMLIKVYAAPREGEQRYGPAEVMEAVPKPVLGNTDRNKAARPISKGKT